MGLGRLLPARAASPLSWDDYQAQLMQMVYGGQRYAVGGGGLSKVAAAAYESNGPVSALIAVRMLVMSEVRFAWQSLRSGEAGRLFGTEDLALLEVPWPGATTRELLSIVEMDVSTAGNSYWIAEGFARGQAQQLTRLEPDKVTILTGDTTNFEGRSVGKHLLGYGYQESPHSDPVVFDVGAVAHVRQLPDRANPFRGRSWLSAVLPEIRSDNEATQLKQSLFKNGAVAGMVVTFDKAVKPEAAEKYRALFERDHQGVSNFYKTVYLGGGSDAKTLGMDLKALDFKAVQGSGETRLAAAAGVPASIVGFSEGLAGSALNAGNYTAARRRFSDGTVRPWWGSVSGAFQQLVRKPDGPSRLWYDEQWVSFLQEDVKDDAEIRHRNAETIRQLIEAGFEPASAVAAVTSGDMSGLKHTGLVSVQLQAPGSGAGAAAAGA